MHRDRRRSGCVRRRECRDADVAGRAWYLARTPIAGHGPRACLYRTRISSPGDGTRLHLGEELAAINERSQQGSRTHKLHCAVILHTLSPEQFFLWETSFGNPLSLRGVEASARIMGTVGRRLVCGGLKNCKTL